MSIVQFNTPAGEPWPAADLSYLGTGRRPAPAFPMNSLGSKWADLVEAIARAASAPVDYVGATLLAIASALLGNVRWPKAGAEWQEAAVLWVVLVGSPGSGKSPGQDLLLACLRNVEDRLDPDFKERLDEYEKERAVAEIRWGQWKTAVKDAMEAGKALPPSPGPLPVRPERPRVRISDITVEKAGVIAAALPRGLLLCRDEIAGWLGSFDRYASGSSDRPFFLEAHGGRSYPIDRVKLAEPIVVRHLSIAVLGGIQPEKLVKIVGGVDDGLLGRFLYVFPESIPIFELRREAVDLKAVETAFARLTELRMGGSVENPDPVLVPLTREAEDEVEIFAREMQKLANESIGNMAGVYAKARGQAMRLANVLEHLYWAVGEERYDTPPAWIDRPALRAAVILVRDYFIPMAERAFGDAMLPRADYLAMQLARELRRRSLLSFNAREVRRAIGGELRSSEAMKAACEQLTEANLIRPRTKPAAGGRPPLDFEANPVLMGQDNSAPVVRAKTAENAKTASAEEMAIGFGTNGTFGTGD